MSRLTTAYYINKKAYIAQDNLSVKFVTILGFGGCRYCVQRLLHSLEAIIFEHISGNSLTNTSNDNEMTARMFLIKTVVTFRARISV